MIVTCFWITITFCTVYKLQGTLQKPQWDFPDPPTGTQQQVGFVKEKPYLHPQQHDPGDCVTAFLHLKVLCPGLSDWVVMIPQFENHHVGLDFAKIMGNQVELWI